MVKFTATVYRGTFTIAILAFTLDGTACRAAWNDETGTTSASLTLPTGQTHAGILASFLKELIAGRTPDAIATTTGPGSFTSVRIQLATALGLKIGYKATPFCPNALEVLASAYPGSVPAINSFRGDFFCLIDNKARCASKEELMNLGKPLRGDLGEPVENFPKILIDYRENHPNPATLAKIAPFYVRSPEYRKRA